MLESAYRLLAAERPLAEVRSPDPVLSRHRLTIGQDLRGTTYRLAATDNLLAALAAVPMDASAKISVKLLRHRSTTVAVVTQVEKPDGTWWNDTTVPAQAFDSHQWSGIAVRLPQATPFPPTDNGRDFLAALAAVAGDRRLEGAEELRPEFALLVRTGSSPRLIWLLDSDEDLLASFKVIQPSTTRSRVEAGYQSLSVRQVGIVGAGSVGSKIAVSLARSGVGLFFLVDEDVLLPENLVRHDLDWLAVGMHKVDGLARRLALVNPGVDITMSKVMLAGQEASSSVAAALEKLADCDLVIDASADPAVFNVLAGFTASARKPFVWMEVLEGGVGGIVAQYRPENEPSPHTMRARISAWCAEQRAPWTRKAVDYASLDDIGIPVVADDSEVSVIAAHATRFALDTVLAGTPSLFPYPVYVVGLRRGWIFNEPFETHPVNVGEPGKTEDQPGSLPPDAASETLKFVADLIETKREVAASS